MPGHPSEDQWIAIQHKTFANWANEQLRMSNRVVENLSVDLSDGVRLVALVEALQFRKIGKVYARPVSRIQMLHNVSLALQAIAEDRVRLVNIGTDDIVDGSLKLTLGLLWHLILRYQISGARAGPPRKLMLAWFQSALPDDLEVTNLTSSWRDGRALHALIEYCKPGLSPNWRGMSPLDGVHNCAVAMKMAEEKLGIPRVISAEDFASPDLDELSAMTYLSYFLRKNSPGFYKTLSWLSKQLDTPVHNFTTDWNNGVLLCKLVNSLGGDVPGWPSFDRSSDVDTCKIGLEAAAQSLGVKKSITAAEMSDPTVDHLTVMAYVSQFRGVIPRLPKAQRCRLKLEEWKATVGHEAKFSITAAAEDTDLSKVAASISGRNTHPAFTVEWADQEATCCFVPLETGLHTIHVQFDGEEIEGSPVTIPVVHDLSGVKVIRPAEQVRVDQPCEIEIVCPEKLRDSVEVRQISPAGDLQILDLSETEDGLKTMFSPRTVGTWTYQTNIGSHEIDICKVVTFNPFAAKLIGPDVAVVGEEVKLTADIKGSGTANIDVGVEYIEDGEIETNAEVALNGDLRYVTFTPEVGGDCVISVKAKGQHIDGSPKLVKVVDPNSIEVTGKGHTKGAKGVEASFTVDATEMREDVTAEIRGPQGAVLVTKTCPSPGVFTFSYTPDVVGTYKLWVSCGERPLVGSPFHACITDGTEVTLADDLEGMQDENERLALKSGQPTVLKFTTKGAGPGTLSAEVLSPEGKLPVSVEQTSDTATLSFHASIEGDHYVHLYWGDAPLESSPILAYCAGPELPVDASKVVIRGKGAESARATVTAEVIIDGKRAGPGVPKVRLQGVQRTLPVEIKAIHYDRYRCRYTAPSPGSFLLYVYWSDVLVPGCPHKINIVAKGDPAKVKVAGSALNGGIVGQEMQLIATTSEAGPGDLAAFFFNGQAEASGCHVTDLGQGQQQLTLYPSETGWHRLYVTLDGSHVTGSPFSVHIGAVPDPSKVRVFGPGIEDGIVGAFESRFLVDTEGAGAGQLAVKVRGPKGGFKVEMRQQTKTERTINCRYDPKEAGEYEIHVRWSGQHVPGSPFTVHLAETRHQLDRLTTERGFRVREERVAGWRAEI